MKFMAAPDDASLPDLRHDAWLVEDRAPPCESCADRLFALRFGLAGMCELQGWSASPPPSPPPPVSSLPPSPPRSVACLGRGPVNEVGCRQALNAGGRGHSQGRHAKEGGDAFPHPSVFVLLSVLAAATGCALAHCMRWGCSGRSQRITAAEAVPVTVPMAIVWGAEADAELPRAEVLGQAAVDKVQRKRRVRALLSSV